MKNSKTILYRGKKKSTGEWVFGYLYKIELPNGLATMILTGDKCGVELFDDERHDYDLGFKLDVDMFLVDEETVGQFVCLDCKNNYIFEGDIVRTRVTNNRFKKNPRFENLVVTYEEKHGQWSNGRIGLFYPLRMEVIGNIFDNKELLEK